MYSETQAIFQQLAAIESPRAVRSVIENHEAWVQSERVAESIAALAVLRGAHSDSRIARQRKRLAAIVTVLPKRLASAG